MGPFFILHLLTAYKNICTRLHNCDVTNVYSNFYVLQMTMCADIFVFDLYKSKGVLCLTIYKYLAPT